MIETPKTKTYQELAEFATNAEREETISAIRAGLADVAAKRTKPAHAALKALAKKYGILTTDS
jgi:hypothetical protein